MREAPYRGPFPIRIARFRADFIENSGRQNGCHSAVEKIVDFALREVHKMLQIPTCQETSRLLIEGSPFFSVRSGMRQGRGSREWEVGPGKTPTLSFPQFRVKI